MDKLKHSVSELPRHGSRAYVESCDMHHVVLLQEHWLPKQDLCVLKSVHRDFDAVGSSPMDLSQRVYTGRPFGGTAILFRKGLGAVSVASDDDERFCAVRISLGTADLLIMRVPAKRESSDD